MSFPFRLRPAFLVVLALLGGCGRQATTKSAAELRSLFDQTEHDLGPIRVGATHSATYRLTNSTGQSIAVSDIKTSCGCVTPDYESFAVNPGDFRDVTLTLKTDQQTVHGPMVKHAWIRFATGERVELQLKARLEPEYEVEPRALKFTAGERQRLTLIRKQLEARAFGKLVLIAPAEFYEAVEDARTSSPDRREFDITLKETPASATLPDIAVSDSPAGKPVPYSIVHCSRQGPTLRPSSCVFIITGEAIPPPQRFEIVDPAERPIRIVSAEASGEKNRQLLAIHRLDARSFNVTLTAIPEKPLNDLRIEVAYETENGAAGRLLLTCYVVVPPKG